MDCPLADFRRVGLFFARAAGGAGIPDRYVIEKSLSIDNILVFLLIFQALRVPGELQHRVLYSGVIGALVMRGYSFSPGLLSCAISTRLCLCLERSCW